MTIEMMDPKNEMVDAMKLLTDIVNDSGGVSDTENITNLIRWMADAKGFDVKIVYICVINATESGDTLLDFISKGGWNCLARWLESFINTEKHAAIRELLKCFQKLPVTKNILSIPVDSKDLPGKMIKGLRKHNDDEIKKLAGTIYKSWVDMVKDAENQEVQKKEKKAKRKKEADAKAKKHKAASGPVLANNFMGEAFLTEEQKNKLKKEKKEAKQKKKDEKKRKEDNSKEGIKTFSGDLSILNSLAPQSQPSNDNSMEGDSVETDKFTNLGNRSPPMHARGGVDSGSSSPPLASEMFPKKPQKPGAKSVRWTDQTGSKPLEQIREFEVIPDERVNVNHQDYKMKMELEAFKEAESTTLDSVESLANLQGLMAKRQWRSPKRTIAILPDAVKKNIDGWSKESKEKALATDKTARTLQKIFVKTQIPLTASEPDPSSEPRALEVPRIPLDLRDAGQPTETVAEKPTEAPPTGMPPGINFDLLNKINTDDIQSALSSKPTAPRPNMYDPAGHSHSRSPPIEDRFGRQHGPTPPRHNERKGSPLIHDGNRFNRYQDRPQPYGQPYPRGPRDGYGPPRDGQNYQPRDRFGRDSPVRREGGPYDRRSPSRGGYNGRRSPPRGSRDRSPPRHQDYRQGGYRR